MINRQVLSVVASVPKQSEHRLWGICCCRAPASVQYFEVGDLVVDGPPAMSEDAENAAAPEDIAVEDLGAAGLPDKRASINHRWTTRTCSLCPLKIDGQHICRHIEQKHLPWIFHLAMACWKCDESASLLGSIRQDHLAKEGHGDESVFLTTFLGVVNDGITPLFLSSLAIGNTGGSMQRRGLPGSGFQ